MIKQATINLKKHKWYHGFFFLFVLVFFVFLFLNQALILSLETLNEQPFISESFTPFLKSLIQNYQKVYSFFLLVTFVSFFLLFLGKTMLCKDETKTLLLKEETPIKIACIRVTESLIVFSYVMVSYFICLLIFPAFFEKLLISLHVLMTEKIHNFPNQLEKVLQTNPEEQFMIRATNPKQIFEFLLYLPQKSWTRLFFFAYLKTVGQLMASFIGLSFLLPWADATWKNKKS